VIRITADQGGLDSFHRSYDPKATITNKEEFRGERLRSTIGIWGRDRSGEAEVPLKPPLRGL